VPRPVFLAIISSHILASYLAREPVTMPDGFVIEGPTAGGHNAPPRRPGLDESGEPIYGERDVVNLDKVQAVGAPYWLAGGQASPHSVEGALAQGARGVQVGTAFALSRESGLAAPLRQAMLTAIAHDELVVRTDPKASPTGFPFKVVQLSGTVADREVAQQRTRICDLGYLRVAYQRPDGSVGQRCPAEPISEFVRKGGDAHEAEGRQCLCNGLTASAGIAQVRRDGSFEPPLLTLGHELEAVRTLHRQHPDGWSAADVMAWLIPPTV
jgi:NAD(P)H-dependent flavin oxidoreductase YrpB (nitropropane dioxygenase family)